MADLDKLAQKYKTKLKISEETQKYKNEVVLPLINKVFEENFVDIFEKLTNELNEKIGSKALTFIKETKDRFVIQGRFHRVFFQKSRVEIMEDIFSLDIVPICIWKGVTKHLGPISVFVNPENNEVKMDIMLDSVENYALKLFDNLIDDEDISM